MAASQTALLVTIAGSLVILILFGIGFEPFMTRQSALIERSLVLRYGAAILGAAVAVLLRFAMVPLFSGSHSAVPYITFFPAVLLVTWYGGFRAGGFAILLSTLSAAYFFVAPGGSLREANPGDLVTLFLFVVVSFGIAFTTESQRRAVQRADQAETTERQQRQRFETTLASIGDAVIATDANGRVTFANKIALSLVKWPEVEVVGKHLDDVFRIVNEFTRKAVESPVARVLREGNIVGLANHTTLIARDGAEAPIDDSAAPIRGADGVVQGTVLVFRDISDRRKAEAASRLLASIVESSDDAIISKDLSGMVTSWNNGAERIFGYSAAEMIGRPISVLADPDHADEMSVILDRIRRGEHVEPFRSRRRTKSGELIHASITVSPVRDGGGQIIGASKIVRNITNEVLAQKEIAEQRERLRVTLGSIGDAEMVTDTSGRVFGGRPKPANEGRLKTGQ
jgi:PAS domain S-box-containing protein